MWLAIMTCALLAGVLAGQYLDSGNPELGSVLSVPGATVLSPPKALPAFSLTDQDGQPITPTQLEGKFTFVFFGYTYCPDVCPNALSMFAAVNKQLAAADVAPQFLFVSVDPKRDSPQRLKSFVRYFDPKFLAATGSEEELTRLTRSFGVVYMQVDNPAGGDYLVDHSASVFLVGPKASLVAVFSAPQKPMQIVSAYSRIIADSR